MNFRELRARLMRNHGRFVLFPDDPEVQKVVSTRAFTHLVIDDDIVLYAHKLMEEQLEEELEENYDVIYEKPMLKGEYYVSPHAKAYNLSFNYKNGAEIFKEVLKKPFDEELDIIENFGKSIDERLNEFFSEIRIGMSGVEIKTHLECVFGSLVDYFAYPTIVAFGEKAKYFTPKTSEYKIPENTIIYVDAWPTYKGYTLNFSRVLFTVENREWINALERMNSMYEKLRMHLTPGASCEEIDAIIRSLGNFPHYSVVPSGGFYMPYAPEKCLMEENMVFTIVPSVYLKDGLIRVKRNVILKKNGPEFLI